MRLFTTKTIQEFANLHVRDKIALTQWQQRILRAQWNNFADIKKDFNPADYVGNNRVVFNICGNKYRAMVEIHFQAKVCFIQFIGTHKTYDKINAKPVSYGKRNHNKQ